MLLKTWQIGQLIISIMPRKLALTGNKVPTDFVDELKRKGDDADGSKALANYDAATEQLRDQLNTATDTDSSADFDDIVLDGKVLLRKLKMTTRAVIPAPMKCQNQ